MLPTDRRTLEFSYADRDAYAFIDPTTFDQIELSEQTLGDVKNYLTAGGKVDVLFVDDKPLTVELPSAVNLKVVESADGIRGDTTSNVQKPAKLETGLDDPGAPLRQGRRARPGQHRRRHVPGPRLRRLA